MNPAPGQSAIEVFVFQAGRFLGSRCFAQRTVVIGSSPQSTLRLRDPSIGARHAVLRLEGNSLVLASDSNEQILVNGEPISVRQVHSFDEIRIGPFRLKFTLLGGDEQDAGFGAETQTSTDVAPDPTREQRVAPTPHASAQGRHGADERDPTFQQHDRARETGRSASLPWLEAEGRDERSGQDFDEDAPTRMAPRPTRPPSEQARTNAAFDAGSQLTDEAAVPRGPTAPPVDRTAPFQSIMEPPGEPKRGRIAYEDTAAQPSAKLPPDDPYAAPEGARDSAEFEAKGDSGSGSSQ